MLLLWQQLIVTRKTRADRSFCIAVAGLKVIFHSASLGIWLRFILLVEHMLDTPIRDQPHQGDGHVDCLGDEGQIAGRKDGDGIQNQGKLALEIAADRFAQ